MADNPLLSIEPVFSSENCGPGGDDPYCPVFWTLTGQIDRLTKLIDMLGEYGRAKFGDEWWPGNAEVWLGREKGRELYELLEIGDRPDEPEEG
jgi:hypothetical protein